MGVNLGNESGTVFPDASAGIPIDSFSIKWISKFSVGENGAYTFYADGDMPANVWVNNQLQTNNQSIQLKANQHSIIRVEYVHYDGDSKLHLQWSGPIFNRQTFLSNKVI